MRTPERAKKSFSLGGAFLALAAVSHGAELPPHAVAVDRWGTWTCERGYLLRNRACVSEDEARREPQFVVSDLPSAGPGARWPR